MKWTLMSMLQKWKMFKPFIVAHGNNFILVYNH
jgi:hypothetical protein